MKLTFPHMGNMFIPIKVLLDSIGIEYVIPPLCNKNTLESGSAHSPEFMCLPFKTMLGDFLDSLKNGADIILCGASCGQCRQGYYGELHNRILNDLGYKYEYIDINLSDLSFNDFYTKIGPLIKGISKFKIAKGLIFAAIVLFKSEKLFSLANHTRCREVKKGGADIILSDFYNKFFKVKTFAQAHRLLLSSIKKIKLIKKDRTKPLRIAIVGEIFTICEPFTNLDIEKRLGALGAEVTNTMSTGLWVKEHGLKKLLPIKPKDNPLEMAQEYIKTPDIGGHGIYTVGNAAYYSKKKFDGIIHIYPFTCMPEIVAQSAFNEIYKKYGVPIMTLIVDELTGEAGYQTRLEAFIDMINLKKIKQPPKKAMSLFPEH